MKTYRIAKTEASSKIVRDLPEEYWTEKDAHFIVKYSSDDELYELGFEIAREQYREKPEQFWLSKETAEQLKEAISEYTKRSYVHVDSFKFDRPIGNVVQVTVQPTIGTALFNIYRILGAQPLSKALKRAIAVLSAIGNTFIPHEDKKTYDIISELERLVKEEG